MRSIDPSRVVVAAIGAALVVLFAGASVVLAVGELVPTELWAAASALSGALVGSLAPAPATKGAANRHAGQQRGLAAAAAAQGDTDGSQRLTQSATIAEQGAATADRVDLRVLILIVIGAVALVAGIDLALRISNAADATQRDLALKNVADTLIALGSAAAGAVVGLLAPPPAQVAVKR